MNDFLTQQSSPLEIKEALFAIHADKALGVDGFSASFFQTNWSVVGPSIICEIQAFFSSWILPSSMNVTYVRLIPKMIGVKSVADYRPIVLCNVYFKIILKLLSLRLKSVLNSIISENQSVFISGRAIFDNILITHEVLHYLKTSQAKKRCSMAVKTDMSKAYDRVEWEFIGLVFKRLGFHETWTTWVMQCITTASYSYLVNDAVYGNVKPDRGIRQGDPLSPYIFFLCGEVLSGLCKLAERTGSFNGVRVARGIPKVNHLLFADDTMFFCHSDSQSCSTLKKILREYEIRSGQKNKHQ